MLQEGKGYREYRDRLQKIQNCEAISLPVPASANIASADNSVHGLDNDSKEFPPRYEDMITPLNTITPYCSVPMDSQAKDISVVEYSQTWLNH